MDDHFGSRLDGVLGAQGRSQKWLAGRIGVSETTVSRWIAGHQKPSAENVQAVAEALGVPSGRFTSSTAPLTHEGVGGGKGVPPRVLSALEPLQRAEATIGSARLLLSGDHVEFDTPPQAGNTGKTGTHDP